MKYIGFILEHDKIAEAVPFRDILGRENDSQLVTKLIGYLSEGDLVFGWMGYFMDLESKQWIAPDAYYTDGTWVWPAYFPYYLQKYPNYKLDETFVQFVASKGFINDKKSKAFNLEKIESELLAKLQSSDKSNG